MILPNDGRLNFPEGGIQNLGRAVLAGWRRDATAIPARIRDPPRL
jgi:hypothetical protein